MQEQPLKVVDYGLGARRTTPCDWWESRFHEEEEALGCKWGGMIVFRSRGLFLLFRWEFVSEIRNGMVLIAGGRARQFRLNE